MKIALITTVIALLCLSVAAEDILQSTETHLDTVHLYKNVEFKVSTTSYSPRKENIIL